jgi:hypothetical protein
MLKTVTLKALTPWPQFNEYEGEVVVEVDGRELTCHVVLSSAQEWKQHRPGERRPAEVWLDRDRTWEKAEPDAEPYFQHIGGVHYELIGTVLDIRAERLTVDAGFLLSVDLETGAAPAGVAVGDKIHVDGSMSIDLDPGSDEAGGAS